MTSAYPANRVSTVVLRDVVITSLTFQAIAVGLVLPFTPLAGLFGFTPLPLGFLSILAVMVVVCLGLVELGKSLFFGRPSARPRRPMADWRHPPGLRRVERLASRWTVHPKARIGSTR
jgi:Mg2+-importing ATPase